MNTHELKYIGLGVLALLIAGITHAEEVPSSTQRIAAISGVHTPHQGFALSATVPSDRMCLNLAQNLSSELGIVVHVICTDPNGGGTTVVAECGYASSREATAVRSFLRSGGVGEKRFLLCVPPDPDRFRAERIAPSVSRLRPQ